MKEVIGKAGKTQPLLPSKIIINNIEIIDNKRIANEFNNLFIDISPELAIEIPRQRLSKAMYQNLTRLCPLDQC